MHCQLQELTRSKSTQPKAVKEALLALPETLDETYQRVLEDLDENDHQHALTLLRWLAYAASPRSLDELAEACIIDPTDDPAADGVVDRANRGAWEDTLEMLAGLVITLGSEEPDTNANTRANTPANTSDVTPDMETPPRLGPRIDKTTKIRLAHFSVKEYLESSRILSTDIRMFHLDPAREHRFLSQSCLVYLISYSRSMALEKVPIEDVFEDLPLLRYCADYWPYHARRQSERNHSVREIRFLSSDLAKRHWLAAKDLNSSWAYYLSASNEEVGPALNHAAYLGLVNVARDLIDQGADINSMGGPHGPPLSEAARRDHPELVRILIDAGADVNIQDGKNGTVLQVAAYFDCTRVVPLLIAAGADLDDSLGTYGTAIQAAAFWGNVAVVETLLRAGANVNAHNKILTSPLTAASSSGHARLARILIDAGADPNIESHVGRTALQEACFNNHKSILKMLLDARADPNVKTYKYGTALHVASRGGAIELVRMLLDAGADVNLPASRARGTALTMACESGHAGIIDMLSYAGPDINEISTGATALSNACWRGHEGIVKMLIQAGAEVNLRPYPYATTALAEACHAGYENVVRLLIDAGAEVNDFETRPGSHALLRACSNGHEGIVRMLLDAGADANTYLGRYGETALQMVCTPRHRSIPLIMTEAAAENDRTSRGGAIRAAWAGGYRDLIPMLIDAASHQKLARGIRSRGEVGTRNAKAGVADGSASAVCAFDDYEARAVSDDDTGANMEIRRSQAETAGAGKAGEVRSDLILYSVVD